MLFPPQTWDILTGIGIASLVTGFLLFALREGWTTTQVFTLSLAITMWFWVSISICRFLSPSLGITDEYVFNNPKWDSTGSEGTTD